MSVLQSLLASVKFAGAAAALFACLSSANAADKSAVDKPTTDKPFSASFSHKDWELRCDNTRTCRAAGYQEESGDSEPVSLLITRAAGPHAPVGMSLQVAPEESLKSPLRLRVGKASVTGQKGDTAEFSPPQVRAVLAELLRAEEAQVTAGDLTWKLSLAGVNAVLLKMDEVQGRLDTPGALARRGSKPESTVLALLPLPVIKTTKPPRDKPSDVALLPKIAASIDLAEARDQCNGGVKIEAAAFELQRLSASRVLLLLPCGMGAYNYSQLAWLANDKPPYNARLIEANGDFDPADGSLHMSMKGRGIGDCWAMQAWHFSGVEFILSEESGDGMCRGFAGGAWNLPSYVTQLKTATPATDIQKKP